MSRKIININVIKNKIKNLEDELERLRNKLVLLTANDTQVGGNAHHTHNTEARPADLIYNDTIFRVSELENIENNENKEDCVIM